MSQLTKDRPRSGGLRPESRPCNARASHATHSRMPPPEGQMVKIRRAYEALFLGLFLFFLFITDLRYLKGWPVSLFLEATPLVAVATALTTHTIYRNLVWGLVIIAITMMLGPGLVQLDVPVRHLAPLLRLDRQSPQHQADDRGQSISQDLRDQVLHPGGDDRDGQPVDHPHRDRRARARSGERTREPNYGRLAFARVFAAVETGIARSAEEHKRTNSTLQIGLLDPIALTVRSMTTSVLPVGAQGDRERLHRAS